MSGLEDFSKAADHVLNLKINQAVVSVFQGFAKLGFTVMFGSLALKPVSSRVWGLIPVRPSMISEFQQSSNPSYITRVLFYKTYESHSKAQALAQFCLRYLQDYPVNYFDIAIDCVKPLADRNHDLFKDWVLKDPIESSYYIGMTVDHSSFKNHQPLLDCTEKNQKFRNVFNGADQILREIVYERSYDKVKEIDGCVARRIDYLKEIFKQSDEEAALSLAKQGCLQQGPSLCDQVVLGIKATLGLS